MCRDEFDPFESYLKRIGMTKEQFEQWQKRERESAERENQPDIHIHIHIHGESGKDLNEIAKVVSDQLGKQFKSAGVILK